MGGSAAVYYYSPGFEVPHTPVEIRITDNGNRVAYHWFNGGGEGAATLLELRGNARLLFDERQREILRSFGTTIIEVDDTQSIRLEQEVGVAGTTLGGGVAGTSSIRIAAPAFSSGCYPYPIYDDEERVVGIRRGPLPVHSPTNDFGVRWDTPDCRRGEPAAVVTYEGSDDQVVENPSVQPSDTYAGTSTEWELEDLGGPLTFVASSSRRAATASQRLLFAGFGLGLAGAILIEEIVLWSRRRRKIRVSRRLRPFGD